MCSMKEAGLIDPGLMLSQMKLKSITKHDSHKQENCRFEIVKCQMLCTPLTESLVEF